MGKQESAIGLIQLIQQAGFAIADTAVLAPRAAEYLPIPEALHPKLRDFLLKSYPKGLFAHQSNAIESALNGSDVCLATATASGKSLVFMSLAIQRVLEDPGTKILVLYPARALIQDQMSKWAEITGPFGLGVDFIDGTVHSDRRIGILKTHNIVLMTPDVLHAWMMRNLQDPDIRGFVRKLRLVVLDEAHVYDGVFGTNTAYLLRRLAVIANNFRLVCCTATLGKPSDFVYQLTGRNVVTFGEEDDKSASPGKTVLLLRPLLKDTFQCSVNLLTGIARASIGRYIAFGDSRKGVEQLVPTYVIDYTEV
ncbi:MAG: DEAD/DEAH box helicase [Chloroflexi bacterium]|nr:DEAD/DEAH box helicase [Chloroflexota bacterium]